MCTSCFGVPPTPGSSSGMDRRDFLRLGGAGLTGVALLGTAGGVALARTGSSLKAEFAAAAKETRVPRRAAPGNGLREHPLGDAPS